MRATASSWLKAAFAVLRKDAVCEFRVRYGLTTLGMFAVITLATVSMGIAGAGLSSELAASLLWVVLFFAAMAGLVRSFVQEQESGTLLALRVYGRGQAVLFGKMAFNVLLLYLVTALIVPLYIVLLNVEVSRWLPFGAALLLGDTGIAAVATLTALMVARTGAKGALFPVITFPVLLPLFLAAVTATVCALNDDGAPVVELLFMVCYDIVVVAAASLLFDYIWQD